MIVGCGEAFADVPLRKVGGTVHVLALLQQSFAALVESQNSHGLLQLVPPRDLQRCQLLLLEVHQRLRLRRDLRVACDVVLHARCDLQHARINSVDVAGNDLSEVSEECGLVGGVLVAGASPWDDTDGDLRVLQAKVRGSKVMPRHHVEQDMPGRHDQAVLAIHHESRTDVAEALRVGIPQCDHDDGREQVAHGFLCDGMTSSCASVEFR
mmetsp:Transcript_3063/g.8321  ORF Transcript_3063/g.8321 Transcript_3063/m.8321 type:complete len:210 (+) Transcript_3063:398-1027(+)